MHLHRLVKAGVCFVVFAGMLGLAYERLIWILSFTVHKLTEKEHLFMKIKKIILVFSHSM